MKENNKQERIIQISLAAILVFTVLAAPASAADYHHVGTGQTYSTIQDAINASNPHDTIIVHDGTYNENVDVYKSVTVRSASGNPADTTVDALNRSNCVFELTANYVNISGFALTNGTYGVDLCNVDHCNISYNTISTFVGINVSNSFNNLIMYNTMTGGGIGISLSSSYKNSLIANSIPSSLFGINLRNSSRNNIFFSDIDSDIWAIKLHSSSDNTMYFNDVNSDIYAVGLTGSPSNTLSYNSISNSVFGIRLDGSADNFVSFNDIDSNGFGVYSNNTSSSNKIYQNNFINNDFGCISSGNIWHSPERITYTYNGNTFTNYLGNYWDDYVDIDVENDGVWDHPYSINGSDMDYHPLVNRFEDYTIRMDGVKFRGIVENEPSAPYDIEVRIGEILMDPEGRLSIGDMAQVDIAEDPSECEVDWPLHQGDSVEVYANHYEYDCWQGYYAVCAWIYSRDNPDSGYIEKIAKSLIVNVYNVNGNPAAEVDGTTSVELIRSGETSPIAEQTIDAESKATFSNVPAGEYYINVRHDPPMEQSDEEFWGQRGDVSIITGTTTTIDFYRHTPYVEEFYVEKSPVAIDAPVNVNVTIKVPLNYTGTEADVKASVIIRDEDGREIYQDTSSSRIVQRGDDTAFSFSYTPTEAGVYSGLAKAYVVGGGELCTDNCGWGELFSVGEYGPKISIPTRAPCYEEGYNGTTFQFIVNVTNGGTVTDEIELSVMDLRGWNPELSNDTVILAPNESEYVYMNATGKDLGSDEIIIKAASGGDQTKYNVAECTIMVRDINPLMLNLSFSTAPWIELSPNQDYAKLYDDGKVPANNFSLFLDTDTKSPTVREVTIILRNIGEELTFKFPDFALISTNFHVWGDGYNFENVGGIWGTEGVCYGMSNTALLYHLYDQKKGGIERPDGYKDATTYDIEKDDTKPDIIYYQNHNPKHFPWDYNNDYAQLKSYIESENTPIILHLAESNLNPLCSKHAIVAYKIVEIDDKAYIYVYDPDFPRVFRLATCSDIDTGEFSYECFGINFPHFRCRAALNLGKPEKTTLSVYCPVNTTITDQVGRIISDNGTNEIPNASMLITNDTKIFYLPADLTYFTEIDAYDTGVFNFTRISPIGTDISITKFEDIPITASTKAFVEIVPDVTNYTMSIDYDGDGVYEINMLPDVNETIEVVQTSYTTQLHTGWNLISAPLNLATWKLGEEAAVGGPLNVTPENSLTSIYQYNTTSESFEKCTHYADWGWAPATGSETFTELEPGRGYWVMAENDCDLTFTGTAPSDLDVPLDADWNCIGWYLTSAALLGEEAVVGDPLIVTPESSLASIYRYNTTSESFEKCTHYTDWGWAPATGSESFTELEPGRGYWVMADNDCMWRHEI